MLNLHLYAAYIAASLIFILAPGPSVTLVLANSLHHSLLRISAIVLGIILADALLMLLAGLGVAVVIKNFPHFFSIFKLLAASYLIYLGIKTLSNTSKEEPDTKAHIQYSALNKYFLQGFFVSIMNPSTVVFFSAFLPLYIDLNYSIKLQLFILIFTFVGIASLVLYTYSFIGKKINLFLHNHQVEFIFNILIGLLLLGMGVYLVLSL